MSKIRIIISNAGSNEILEDIKVKATSIEEGDEAQLAALVIDHLEHAFNVEETYEVPDAQ